MTLSEDNYCKCGHDLDEHEEQETSLPCTHKMDSTMGDIEDCPCRDFDEWGRL